MSRSLRYRALDNRLRELRRHLLPKRFSTTGIYKPRELDKIRGYRVLVHAEIEAFIEERAWQTVLDALRKWKTDNKPRHVITALLAFRKVDSVEPNSLDACVDAASRSFHHRITQNNGIKEDDVLKLLLPIGVLSTDLDTTWLNSLNSFGVSRGEVAHSSSRVHQPIDPQSEYQNVTQLLAGLRDLDHLINMLR